MLFVRIVGHDQPSCLDAIAQFGLHCEANSRQVNLRFGLSMINCRVQLAGFLVRQSANPFLGEVNSGDHNESSCLGSVGMAPDGNVRIRQSPSMLVRFRFDHPLNEANAVTLVPPDEIACLHRGAIRIEHHLRCTTLRIIESPRITQHGEASTQ